MKPILPAAVLLFSLTSLVHAAFDSATVSGLGARNIGSAAMSGRVSALTAVNEPDGKLTVYVGAASGGVWKSLDGGTTYKPVFDKQPVQSIGALAVDPSNSKTLWVGTGETWVRNSVSVGDGIYKSTDGGDNWTRMGLAESERISRIVVHPKNGKMVYACVPGKLWSDSAERGLYQTRDGGKTWTQILKGANLSTGCASLSMDAKNPAVLYASLWDFRRQGWTFRSGGAGPEAFSGSGLYKSTDGGKTWKEFTPEKHKGFPPKPYGRIAVAAAPSNPLRVYAAVEAVRGALFVSNDGGKTWEERDRSNSMVWRPFYFSQLIVDPKDANKLFKPNGAMIMSNDGGKSFSTVGGFAGMHGDVHDLWINPLNTQQVLGGDDGGMWYSDNGGTLWRKGDNLPISQFYHVSADDQDPYQVYGGLQDNSSWVGDSSYPGGITNDRWENLFGGDGFWTFSDPADPDYAYAEWQGGGITRINRKTRDKRLIQPQARAGEKLRWNWNAPIHLSPNEKGTLYIGSQFLHRTRDHGQSWERISPDLTTNDPQKQKQEESGGITVDNSAAEMHTTIYTISESPRNSKLIWVGTDDGNVQLTRDAGKNWSNVTANLPELPAQSWVSWIEASRFDEATAYAAFDRHTFGDLNPYVYKTLDFGKSWTRILSPQQGVSGYAHVIREDTVNPSLLFAGTEFGLWISLDGGQAWAQYRGNSFPSVAVRDLVIQARDADLVIGTHGRGIWIVDDITPLRSLSAELMAQDAALLAARPVQQRIEAWGGWSEGAAKFSGTPAPTGVVINFWQRTRHLFGKLKLEVLNAEGKLMTTLPVPKRRGLNRVTWSGYMDPPRVPPAVQIAGWALQGPRVPPGEYTVRLTKAGQVYESKIEIGLDRRVTFTLADRKANFDTAMRAHTLFGQMTDLLSDITALRDNASAALSKLPAVDAGRAGLEARVNAAQELRKKIVATKEGGAITGEERLREHLDTLYGLLIVHDGKPTAEALARLDALSAELAGVKRDYEALKAAGAV